MRPRDPMADVPFTGSASEGGGVGSPLTMLPADTEGATAAAFIALVLGATAAYVYALRRSSFKVLVLAMYFPGALALLFVAGGYGLEAGAAPSAVSERLLQFVEQSAFGRRHAWADPMRGGALTPLAPPTRLALWGWSVAGAVLPVLVVFSCALLNLLVGWARVVPDDPRARASDHNHDLFVSFLRAAGEELGWRCYLLPVLVSVCGSMHGATLVLGAVWGLYHVPVMLLLVHKLNVARPWLTCTVQGLNLVVQGYMYTLVAIHSGYALWPPALMHWVWNRVNPTVLGSIYTQVPGLVQGEQWLINGEGLSGILIGLPIAFVVAVLFPA